MNPPADPHKPPARQFMPPRMCRLCYATIRAEEDGLHAWGTRVCFACRKRIREGVNDGTDQ